LALPTGLFALPTGLLALPTGLLAVLISSERLPIAIDGLPIAPECLPIAIDGLPIVIDGLPIVIESVPIVAESRHLQTGTSRAWGTEWDETAGNCGTGGSFLLVVRPPSPTRCPLSVVRDSLFVIRASFRARMRVSLSRLRTYPRSRASTVWRSMRAASDK
jgi:hypothetical protein